MKTTTTTENLEVNDRGEGERASIATPAVPVAPESVIRAICLDAKHDSLKFVLRSDTGHDGE